MRQITAGLALENLSAFGVAPMLKRHWILAAILFAVFPSSLATLLSAQGTTSNPGTDQILSYDSDITVNADGTLQVRETIRLFATSATFKHGIYRDIPTGYYDRFGNTYNVHFEVLSFNRDDEPEDVRLEKISDGLRIYMGQSRDIIPTGEHTYELTYVVDRSIGFFPSHDELYWNVTGNGWAFPIEKASAVVHLPKGIIKQAIIPDAYTGRQGSVETGYVAAADDQSNAAFRTTRALGPHEGLTLVVRWPKGFVHPPTDDQKHHYFVEDHQAGLVGAAGLVVLLIYYLAVWLRLRRGSVQGEIEPTSEPPRRDSPGALRYVWRRGFDQKTILASLVDLGVKGQLAVLEDVYGGFILGYARTNAESYRSALGSHVDSAQAITRDEKIVIEELFAESDTVRLEPANQALVGRVAEALHHYLRSNQEKADFVATARYVIPGLLISVATLVRCGFTVQGGQRLPVPVLTIGLLICGLGCLSQANLAIAFWRYALSDPYHSPTGRKSAMYTSAICLLLFAGEMAGLGVMAWAASSEVAVVLTFCILANYIFHRVLMAPSRASCTLMDQIESFRAFLAPADPQGSEGRRWLEISPDDADRFLPYAMALNVEKLWGDQFAATLAQSGNAGIMTYSPAWYSGPSWNLNSASAFATRLGSSFSRAISPATAVPHSSPSSALPGGRGV